MVLSIRLSDKSCKTNIAFFHRFLQGPETDQRTVSKIRDAIREQREITVQLINYTKSGSYKQKKIIEKKKKKGTFMLTETLFD